MARKRTTTTTRTKAARVNTGDEVLTATTPAGKRVKYTKKTEAFIARIKRYIANPPKTSVVLEFDAESAAAVLRAFNKCNRPPKARSIRAVHLALKANEFMLTGDTVKFNDKGELCDGQNRLIGCVEAEDKKLTTHVVFGISKIAFDRMDTGTTRSAQDMLRLAGISNAAEAAHVIAYMEKQRYVQNDETPFGKYLQPYEIVDLAITRYQDVQRYVDTGRELQRVAGLATSRGAFVHYALTRYGDRELADKFMNVWLGRSAPGEVPQIADVNKRLATIRNAGKTPSARDVYTAAVVAYNAWVTGSRVRMTDMREQSFTPKIEQAA